METKKTYKADLEHRRKYILSAAFIVVCSLFIAALQIPLGEPASVLSLDALESIAADREFVPMPEVETVADVPADDEPVTADRINIVDEPAAADELTLEGDNVESVADETPVEEVADEPLPLPDDGPVFRVVECLPEFPGGAGAFAKWLTDNLRYPPTAQKQKVEGKVTVSFIVNADGSISDSKIVASPDSRLDNEVLRVIGLMPPWTPGKEKGEPCRTMLVLPVVFAL